MYSRSNRPVPPPDYSGVAYGNPKSFAEQDSNGAGSSGMRQFRTSSRSADTEDSANHEGYPRYPIDTRAEYESNWPQRRRSLSMPDSYPGGGENLPLKISEKYRTYVSESGGEPQDDREETRGGEDDRRSGFPHRSSDLRRYSIKRGHSKSDEAAEKPQPKIVRPAAPKSTVSDKAQPKPEKPRPEPTSLFSSGAGLLGSLSKFAEKSFTLEDLMLIGLILLLLQNDADNDIIILLGFLLIVGF